MFAKYGGAWGKGVPLLDLIAHNLEHSDLIARAENSGSEGCYCEVARWNYGSNRWERYAFEKFFSDDHDKSWELAALAANAINNASGMPLVSFIHNLPSYGEAA